MLTTTSICLVFIGKVNRRNVKRTIGNNVKMRMWHIHMYCCVKEGSPSDFGHTTREERYLNNLICLYNFYNPTQKHILQFNAGIVIRAYFYFTKLDDDGTN